MATPLPSGYTFGKVVGQAIRAVGDTPNDPDYFPEAEPITGKKCVSFTPKVPQVVTPDNGVATMVMQDKIECDMNSDGQLIRNGEDPGELGVWLYTGVWTVAFTGVMSGIQSFDILITEFHAEDPLDLFANMATPIPPSDPVTTLVVPSGGSEDMVLSWIDGRLQWVNRMDFPDGEYLVQAQQAAQTSVDAKNVSVSSKDTAVSAKNDAVQAKNDAQTFAANFNTWFLRGNGSPVGIVTPASAGVQYVDLAATNGARVWIGTRTASTSWRVVEGDTGLRDVTSILTFPSVVTVEKAVLSRVGQICTFSIRNMTLSEAYSGGLMLGIPKGFKPSDQNVRYYNGKARLDMYSGNYGGDGWLFDSVGASFVYMTWVTRDAWPTTLPGTPA